MAPIRKYLKIGQHQVVVVHIHLDDELLRSLAQKVRTSNEATGPGDDTDSIQQLNPFSLPARDVEAFVNAVSPHIVRVFSTPDNNAYSCAEFYNLHGGGVGANGRKRKEEAGVMRYRFQEHGWKAGIKIERPENAWEVFGGSYYSDEQVLERKLEIQEKLEPTEEVGEEEEEEEKPLAVKTKVEAKYRRLFVVDEQRVEVYLQQRPAKVKPSTS